MVFYLVSTKMIYSSPEIATYFTRRHASALRNSHIFQEISHKPCVRLSYIYAWTLLQLRSLTAPGILTFFIFSFHFFFLFFPLLFFSRFPSSARAQPSARTFLVGMKTDRIRTDIVDTIFVFIFLLGFGFEHG